MADQFIGTDVASMLESKKQSRLFTDLPTGKSLNFGTFLSHVTGWVITRTLGVVSAFLNLILSLEKAIINLRLDTLQLFYWGRGNVFGLFMQAVLLFVFGAIGFTWIVGQGLTPRIVQGYVPSTPSQVFAASASDIVVEAGSLTTILPKELKRLEMEDYVVTYEDTIGGDTLANIAYDWDVSEDSIRWSNNYSKTFQPKAGVVVKIPPISGSIYTFAKGETLALIASRYKVGESTLIEVNFLSPPFEVKAGQKIFLPGVSPKVSPPKNKPATNYNAPGGKRKPFNVPTGPKFLNWPIQGGKGTRSGCFSGAHDGIDISPSGSTIPMVVAAANGTVTYAGVHCTPGWWGSPCGGYAGVVEIDHGNGFSTIYGHLSLSKNSIQVKKGDTVTAGQVIAQMGSTGTSFGTHLHFQLNNGGFLRQSKLRPVNPIPFMRAPKFCN